MDVKSVPVRYLKLKIMMLTNIVGHKWMKI